MVVGVTAVEAGPFALAYYRGVIWVSSYSAGTISAVRPQNGRVLETFAAGPGPTGFDFLGSDIWIANNAPQMDSVSRLNPGSGQLVTLPSGALPYDVVSIGDSIWVSNSGEQTLTKYSPHSP